MRARGVWLAVEQDGHDAVRVYHLLAFQFVQGGDCCSADPVWASFLYGCIVSATDPVAVVAVLGALGAPAKLGHMIEAESLLNDGTAVVLFFVCQKALRHDIENIGAPDPSLPGALLACLPRAEGPTGRGSAPPTQCTCADIACAPRRARRLLRSCEACGGMWRRAPA